MNYIENPFLRDHQSTMRSGDATNHGCNENGEGDTIITGQIENDILAHYEENGDKGMENLGDEGMENLQDNNDILTHYEENGDEVMNNCVEWAIREASNRDPDPDIFQDKIVPEKDASELVEIDNKMVEVEKRDIAIKKHIVSKSDEI